MGLEAELNYQQLVIAETEKFIPIGVTALKASMTNNGIKSNTKLRRAVRGKAKMYYDDVDAVYFTTKRYGFIMAAGRGHNKKIDSLSRTIPLVSARDWISPAINSIQGEFANNIAAIGANTIVRLMTFKI